MARSWRSTSSLAARTALGHSDDRRPFKGLYLRGAEHNAANATLSYRAAYSEAAAELSWLRRAK